MKKRTFTFLTTEACNAVYDFLDYWEHCAAQMNDKQIETSTDYAASELKRYCKKHGIAVAEA